MDVLTILSTWTIWLSDKKVFILFLYFLSRLTSLISIPPYPPWITIVEQRVTLINLFKDAQSFNPNVSLCYLLLICASFGTDG